MSEQNWRLMRREEREEYEKALYARLDRQYDEQYARVGAKIESVRHGAAGVDKKKK